MPWKECHVMDERMRFVVRLEDGETMAALCDEFGISRKTGYQIYARYKEVGLHGLMDRSRRLYRHANQLPLAVEKLIVLRRKRHTPRRPMCCSSRRASMRFSSASITNGRIRLSV